MTPRTGKQKEVLVVPVSEPSVFIRLGAKVSASAISGKRSPKRHGTVAVPSSCPDMFRVYEEGITNWCCCWLWSLASRSGGGTLGRCLGWFALIC